MKNNYFKNIKVSDNIDTAIENGLSKAKYEKSKLKVRNISAVSILCISILGISMVFDNSIFANFKQAFYTVSEYFGINSDLSEYKKTIGTSISDNGYTFTLNEVVLDKNQLTVSSTIKSDNSTLQGFPSTVESIYINNKRVSLNSNSESHRVDDYTINQVSTYFIDDDLVGNIDIKIEYANIQLIDDYLVEPINIAGSWTFNFTTTPDELVKNTVSVNLNKKLKLDNKTSIKLTKYISNSLGTKIEFENTQQESNYTMKLVGNDNLGNNLEFDVIYSNNGKGIFRLDSANGSISKDSSSLNLNLYIKDVTSSDDWIKSGNEFIINLKK